MLSSAWALIKDVRRVRIQEGGIAELHGHGAAVDLDFGGEGRVVHHYYTSNKKRPLLGERRGCWPEWAADITARTSLPWSDDTFGRVSGQLDGEAAVDVSLRHSRCRVERSTS